MAKLYRASVRERTTAPGNMALSVLLGPPMAATTPAWIALALALSDRNDIREVIAVPSSSMKSPSCGSMLRTGRVGVGLFDSEPLPHPGGRSLGRGVSTTMQRTLSRTSRWLCVLCSSMVFMAYLDLLSDSSAWRLCQLGKTSIQASKIPRNPHNWPAFHALATTMILMQYLSFIADNPVERRDFSVCNRPDRRLNVLT